MIMLLNSVCFTTTVIKQRGSDVPHDICLWLNHLMKYLNQLVWTVAVVSLLHVHEQHQDIYSCSLSEMNLSFLPGKQLHWTVHYSVEALWWLDIGVLLKLLCGCCIVLLGGLLIVSGRPGVGVVRCCWAWMICWHGPSRMTFSWMTGVAERAKRGAREKETERAIITKTE